jgi:adenine-specific DNA-methyltransferase
MRSALVEYFQNEGRIMIATEAGAEGINLQFCSLVVNYDLPWNPQRIEQRIGRCHRYGQKHDVVVVNFLNRKNEADRRVYELLSEKFQLFEGVFGASDEVLGAIGSGVDFEKRIAMIYQDCRKPEEIKTAFDKLQLELNFEINEAMTSTRQKLLDNFDDEVREKLKMRDEKSRAYLDKFEHWLMELTKHELGEHARFLNEWSFELESSPFSTNGSGPLGLYELPRHSREAHFYRLGHPLAEAVLKQATERSLATAELHFNYSEYEGRISIVEPLLGKSGWLSLAILTVEALDRKEDHLLFGAVTDFGEEIDAETASRLMSVPAQVTQTTTASSEVNEVLENLTRRYELRIHREISERNANFFGEEVEKLDGWADDLKLGLEREIKEIDRQIKEARRAAASALTLEEKLSGQKQIKSLESLRNQKRRSLFSAQDEVDDRREKLIAQIEAKLTQSSSLTHLFTIRWRL